MSCKRGKNKLILIGGVSGTGKSTLANLLDSRGIATHKRIHEFAFDIAKEIDVGIENIFNQWNSHLPEIIARTVDYSIQNSPIVSDVHFAIQPSADTTFLIEGRVDDNLLLREDFRPAFTAEDLAKIANSNIKLILVLITCSIDELLSRRKKMLHQNLPVRSLNRDIIEKECLAEMQVYMSLINQLGQNSNIFANPDNKFDTLYQRVLALI